MSQRWTHHELSALIARRHGQTEGQGEGGLIEFRIKATPELLESMLGGYWTTKDGKVSRLEAIYIDDEGLLYPEMVVVKAVA